MGSIRDVAAVIVNVCLRRVHPAASDLREDLLVRVAGVPGGQRWSRSAACWSAALRAADALMYGSSCSQPGNTGSRPCDGVLRTRHRLLS
jgi:hypothetical protein